MTIDERLERLTERHEALTMNVELMGHRIDGAITAINQVITAINKDAENIRALTHIVEMHEHRIGDLEEGRS
jgi:archaellum component FlaC